MIPTAENFAELLREEVHTLRVMYRVGEMRMGYTAWDVWVESHITEAAQKEWANPCFVVVTDDGKRWDTTKRNLGVEQSYQEPFGGHVYQQERNEHCCIQIVFMDARKQHRRAVRTMQA